MFKRVLLAMGAGVALGGCGAAGPATPTAPRVAPLKPSVAELAITVDGKPFPLKGGAAFSQGSSEVTVVLSTHPLPCSAFEASGRATAEGQRDITLQFARRVQEDGSLTLVAVGASVEGRSLRDKAALKGLTLASADAAQPLALTADYSAAEEANDFLKWPALAATVKGKAVIQGCGVRHNSIDADLSARPQPGLTVTYAGHAVTVQGATLSEDELRLSSGRLDCKLAGRKDLMIEAELPSKFEPKHTVTVNGDLFGSTSKFLVAPKPAEGEPPAEWLTVTPGPKPADAKAPQPVQVEGSFKAHGHVLTIKGTAQAMRCR